MHLRQFLNEINGRLEIQNTWLPQLQSSPDISLKKAFLSQKPTRMDLKVLNNWRLYYKVIFFSKICYPSGKSIQPIYLNYNHDLNLYSKLNWPIQDKPNEVSFAIWRKYIKTCFITPSNTHIPPLGVWDLQAVLGTSPQQCYFSPAHNNIYISQPTMDCKVYPASFTKRDQVSIPRDKPIPPDTIPSDLHRMDLHYIIDLWHQQKYRPPIQQPRQMPECQALIVQHVEVYDIELFKQMVQDEHADINIVSDGGVHNYHRNFGKGDSLAINYGKLYSIEFYESSYLRIGRNYMEYWRDL
jgi:hypothetical protein